MYIEEEYIREQFTSNFLNKQQGDIVIYGTGIHTQHLLECVHDPRIIGLMDSKKTGQELWGYKVLSYNEVAKLAKQKDISIVIIARNAVITIIYRRIEVFCRKHHIHVFDLHGNNLHEHLPENKCQECFCLDEKALLKEIQSADIVTFDIFDTLLTRSLMRPRDVFSVIDAKINAIDIGTNKVNTNIHSHTNISSNNYFPKKKYCFSQERIKAENSFLPGSNPSLEEIYQQLQKNTGISNEEISWLMYMEISVEKCFLLRRKRMCDLLEQAVQMGKNVYLISDMYFSKEIIEEILREFHICGYKDLFVSCTCKVSKQEGLFEYVKKTLSINIEKNRCLHIGDHYFSDIVAAKRAGFQAFQIFSPIEMLESSIYAKGLSHSHSLEENIILSYFAAHAYNNPFCRCRENGKLFLESSEEAAGLLIAPVIFKYMVWLVQNIIKNQHDFVIFPSRDGYLLQKIYHLIQERKKITLPKSIYFYTSRRAALVAAVKDKEEVKEILKVEYGKDRKSLFRDRFGIVFDVENEVNDENKVDLEAILKNCREEKKYYLRYIHEVGLDQYENPAILDFVAMGSVQEALQRMMDKSFTGYYFLKRSGNKKCMEDLCSYSLYQRAGDFQNMANLYQYYYFLESVLTSYEPTFWGMDKYGGKLFYPENRDGRAIQLLKRIHTRILKVCEELLDIFPDILCADSPVDVYDFLLGLFSSDYSDLGNDELFLLENIDEFMGRKVSDINR